MLWQEVDIIDQLKQTIVLEWHHYQRGRFMITASVNGDVVCGVL